MDDVDRKLLAILRRNARESFTDMARQLDLSEGTVRSRMRKMVDDGTIRNFTIRTAGNHVKALIEVSVTNNVHTSDVAKTIRSWNGVEGVWEVTGENDIVVVAECPDTEDLNVIIDRIRAVPGIHATRSRLVLKEH